MIYAFDVETHPIQPGLPSPPVVCAAVSEGKTTDLVDLRGARPIIRHILTEHELTNAFTVYDLGCMVADDPTLMDLVYRALDQDRIRCILVSETLHDIGRGCAYLDQSTGREFPFYWQGLLEQRYLGVDRTAEKKGPDVWRLRYHELEGTPIDQWPAEAVEYPKADAHNAWLIDAAQAGHENAHCRGDEMRAAWALHRAHQWGLRTDPEKTAALVAEIQRQHEETRLRFLDHKIVKERKCKGGKKPEAPEFFRDGVGMRWATDTKHLAALVTKAYQGKPPITPPSKKFPRGQVSTARDTLLASGDPVLADFGKAGPNERLYSVYSKVILQGTTVPINAKYQNPMVTARTSIAEPPLQQLPRGGKIRECFKAR